VDFNNIFRGAAPLESYLAEEFNMTGIISEGLRFWNSLPTKKRTILHVMENHSSKSFSQCWYPRFIMHATLVPRKQIS